MDTMTAYTEPDSTVTRTEGRTITHRWMRPEVETNDHADPDARRAVELTTYHDKDRKCYVASVQIIDVHAGYISPYHGIRIHREPTARYSAKGLKAASDFVLAALPTILATEERVAILFAGHPMPGAR
jgi:hypothetical protein